MCNQKFSNQFTYDYSTFINSYSATNKMKVFCKQHSIFFNVTPKTHLNQAQTGGCPECFKLQKKSRFLDQCQKQVPNSLYDYSKADFQNDDIPIKIICKLHGEFEQPPRYHLTKYGICPKCADLIKQERFIKKAHIKFKNRFNYDKFLYTGSISKGIITCLEHGDFEQTPTQHLALKEPCPSCGNMYGNSTESFINKAQQQYGDLYDYSLVKYYNHRTVVKIICKEHGIFYITPLSFFKRNVGCPKCSEAKQYSQMEIEWLNSLLVPIRLFKIQKSTVDGYDPKTNTIYEFLGDYWHGNLEIYQASQMNLTKKLTFGELNKRTFERLHKLKNEGYNVVYIWESDWQNKKTAKTL